MLKKGIRVEKQSQSYTKRQSINVIGLRKERVGEKKPMPYDIENFAFSTSYNQVDHRDFESRRKFRSKCKGRRNL